MVPPYLGASVLGAAGACCGFSVTEVLGAVGVVVGVVGVVGLVDVAGVGGAAAGAQAATTSDSAIRPLTANHITLLFKITSFYYLIS